MNGVKILEGDVRETLKTLPPDSVHCVVTSPPYWGLRDYGVAGQMGMEKTLDEYIAGMVSVFREVRRVLRSDGTCWVNIGDSYNANSGSGFDTSNDGGARKKVAATRVMQRPEGLKPKDLVGIPWMLAFALRADGWWLRQDIIWHKPNPMPESVSDRCTKAHEYIFLLTKSAHYYFDNEAIKEPAGLTGRGNANGFRGGAYCNGSTFNNSHGGRRTSSGNKARKPASSRGVPVEDNGTSSGGVAGSVPWEGDTRNKRSVWTVSTKPYKEAHFATYPPDLIRPCIQAGTSEHGCCHDCGAPWERIIESDRVATRPGTDSKVADGADAMKVGHRDSQRHVSSSRTVGWKPTCACGHPDTENVPCTVLDPFNGSGTTGEVARDCGCLYIGCELNRQYIALTKKRLRQHVILS
jgi:site-specific DNA-methyltransferase (adenine-specific)